MGINIEREGVRRNEREIRMFVARAKLSPADAAEVEHLVDIAFRQGFTQGYADANVAYEEGMKRVTNTIFNR